MCINIFFLREIATCVALSNISSSRDRLITGELKISSFLEQRSVSKLHKQIVVYNIEVSLGNTVNHSILPASFMSAIMDSGCRALRVALCKSRRKDFLKKIFHI